MSLKFKPEDPSLAEVQIQKRTLAESKHLTAEELLQARLFQRLDKDDLFRRVILEGWIGKTIKQLDELMDECHPDQLLSLRAQRKQMKLMKEELEGFMTASTGKIEELTQTLAEIEEQEKGLVSQ